MVTGQTFQIDESSWCLFCCRFFLLYYYCGTSSGKVLSLSLMLLLVAETNYLLFNWVLLAKKLITVSSLLDHSRISNFYKGFSLQTGYYLNWFAFFHDYCTGSCYELIVIVLSGGHQHKQCNFSQRVYLISDKALQHKEVWACEFWRCQSK